MKKVGKVILRVFVVVAAVAGTIAGLFFFKKKRKIRITEDIETDDTQIDDTQTGDTQTDDIKTDDTQTDDASNSKAD
jgi:flagellar basal body-associated protein FliL